jgi:hypothetical protein
MYHAAMGAMQGMNLQQIYARIEDVLWDTQKVRTLSIAWCCGVRRRRMRPCDLWRRDPLQLLTLHLLILLERNRRSGSSGYVIVSSRKKIERRRLASARQARTVGQSKSQSERFPPSPSFFRFLSSCSISGTFPSGTS